MDMHAERMKWAPLSIAKIKVTDNIITDEDAKFFMDYMDNNLDKFVTDASREIPNRHILRFGYDEVWEDSKPDMALIEDIKDLVNKYRDILVDKVKELYGDEEIYLTSFHMGKQGAGAKVLRHLDGAVDVNPQFKYSGIVYLNTVEDGGDLSFPNLQFSVKPLKNQFITFPAYDGIIYDHEVNKIGSDRYCLPCWFTTDKKLEVIFPN